MVSIEQKQSIIKFLDSFNSFIGNKKIKPKLVAVSKKKLEKNDNENKKSEQNKEKQEEK